MRLDLRTLILVLCALTALVMLCASYFASYRVQRQLLIDHALEANRVYAAKLAAITETYIRNALQQLAFSAGVQRQQLADSAALRAETDRVLGQSMAFNSTFVIDANGVLLSVSPAHLRHLVGGRMQSPGVEEALHERNILNSLLGEHFYKDGSYLYVVDSQRRLLYHPNPQRVGTVVQSNSLINQLGTLRNGTRQLSNSQGVEMLAGFATVPSAGWGVVAQQPLTRTLTPLGDLILNVVGTSAPLALVGFLLLWWLALVIAQPLWQLAAGARTMDSPETAEHLRRVPAWYFEAAELKRALLFGLNLLQERIGRLNRDAQTDPLTGLVNRRGLEFSLALLQAEGRSFSAIVLDIDHFKRVNDNHGHEVGDQVLRRLAELMRSCCREGDLLCRTGGEEFLMLLPGAGLEVAANVAERLRLTVQDTPLEPVGAVTVSLGVARWDAKGGNEPADALGAADRALYQAKQQGRNRVVHA